MDLETARAVPTSPVSCTISMREHTIVQDKPQALGGADAGAMASEILMAALLACQLSTFEKIKAKRAADVTVVDVQAVCHFNDAGDIEQFDVHWQFVAGYDEKAAATLVRLTDKVCTISRALSVPVEAAFSAAR